MVDRSMWFTVARAHRAAGYAPDIAREGSCSIVDTRIDIVFGQERRQRV